MDWILVNIVLSLLILSISSAFTGVYTYIRNESLSADAIAHATLPGVCIGFMIAGFKSTVWMYSGAFFTGLLCQFLIQFISQKSKIKKDTATAIVLSSLFFTRFSPVKIHYGLTFLFKQKWTKSFSLRSSSFYPAK
jgi:ABC-type Mn2+/Zn2+ transport system permease subunit